MNLPNKFILRNSDRNLFKSCRVKWDYASKQRQGWTSLRTIEPLEFGSAIHYAMEAIYIPERQNDPLAIRAAEAQLRFNEYMHGWKQKLIDLESYRGTGMPARLEELTNLGNGMLSRYCEWILTEDLDWEPVHSEIEFEVPIPVPEDYNLSKLGSFYYGTMECRFGKANVDGKSNCLIVECIDGNCIPVYYQGRIDNIFRHRSTGRLWIWDHKTTGVMQTNFDWLDLDTQASSYFWATRTVLNLDVEGVLFNFLLKANPEPPVVNKNGSLSKNRSQKTTKALYYKEIADRNLNPFEYKDFLDSFEEATYFHREPVLKSDRELALVGRTIFEEALDMVGGPRIYTNPGQFNCRGCAFINPCKLRQEGSDDTFLLEADPMYTRVTTLGE